MEDGDRQEEMKKPPLPTVSDAVAQDESNSVKVGCTDSIFNQDFTSVS